MPRLFSALPLPETLVDALMDLEAPLPGARWIAADNLHITLRFFGDVDPMTADALADGLAQVTGGPLEVQLRGVTAFGGRKPRTLHVEVATSSELTALQQAHEQAARSVGLAPEGRKYAPHITVARLNGTRADDVADFCEDCSGLTFPSFVAERVALLSARPNYGGGPYLQEASYPLDGHGLARRLKEPDRDRRASFGPDHREQSADEAETTAWLARQLGET